MDQNNYFCASGDHLVFSYLFVNILFMSTVHYQIKGSGPAIVLLHGFMESMEMYHTFIPVLSKDLSVVMIDLPGHGKSKCLGDVHTMPLMAGAVKEVMDKENISQATFIGHSMGGYVALAFAKEWPGYVNGLALFHSHPDGDTPEAKTNRERMQKLIHKDKASFIASFIPSLYAFPEKMQDKVSHQAEIARKMDPRAILAALKGMKIRESTVEVISNAPYPVLFIAGKNDQRIPLKRVLELVGLPPHSEALILEDVGHMGFHEATQKTLSKIHHFAIRCAGV